MKQAKFTNEDGFTLLEALIAMVILFIGVLSLFTMLITTMRGNVFAYKLTEATAIAQEQVEKVLAWKYGDARLEDDDDVEFEDPEDSSKTTTIDGKQKVDDKENYGDYTAYLDVEYILKDPAKPASKKIGKKVVVYVLWKENGKIKHLRMSINKLNLS